MNAMLWIHFLAGFSIYFSIGCIVETILMSSDKSLKANLDEAMSDLHWRYGLPVHLFQGLAFLVLGFMWPYLVIVRLTLWIKGTSRNSEEE